MVIPKSITKRYTPPTCTLEVVAKTSLLSRWSKRPLLKDLQFSLRFDDPRKPQEEQVTITGDQNQLEILCDQVSDYVQHFLGQTPLQTPHLRLPTGSCGDTQAGEPETTTTTSLEPIASQGNSSSLIALSSHPQIQGTSLLAHQLFFGDLATQASGAKITLNALQMFDLATALDEYSAEMAALPALNSSPRRTLLQPTWAGMAAAVMLAVGLTTAVLKLSENVQIASQTSDTVAEQETTPAELPADELASIAVPELGENFPLPSPTLPPPLATAEKLSPPQAVAPPNSAPGSSPLNIPTQSSTLPAPPRVPNTGITLTPRSKTASPTPPSTTDTTPKTQTPAPKTSNIPEPLPTIAPSENISPVPTKPPQIPANLPPLVARGGSTAEDNSSELPEEQGDELRATPNVDGDIVAVEQAAERENRQRLVTNVPQLAQAKTYFQERWQPPEGLDNTLEYRLFLNPDGTVQRIVPLGKVSEVYIDRTGMPLFNEPFVAPFAEEENPQMRVVLGADGSVQAFLE